MSNDGRKDALLDGSERTYVRARVGKVLRARTMIRQGRMDTPHRLEAALAIASNDMRLDFVQGISQVTRLKRLLAGPTEEM